MGLRYKLQFFFLLMYLFNFFTKFKIFKRSLWYIAGFNISSKSMVYSVKYFSFKKLNIDDNTVINSGVYLDNRRGIDIGKNVVIAHDTKIYTLGHDFEDDSFITKGKKVTIHDDVVLFSNVLIMPGVEVQKGCVILPGSVVTKSTVPMMVYGGNPARPIRARENTHKTRKLNYYYFQQP